MSLDGDRHDADPDRLPWLEPYREPAGNRGRPRVVGTRSGGRGPLLAGGALLLLIGGLGGGYWIGQQRAARVSSTAPAESPARASAPSPAPERIAESKPVETASVATPVAEPAAKPTAKAAPSRPRAKRASPASRPVRVHRRSATERRYAAVVAKQREAARTWPKMPSPGPAGQVIQLGAFSTPQRAERAYAARRERYPLLATMPKVVVPVITQPRGQTLYVLRLGTQSRDQSKTVCRNLRASGDHCLVIG